MRIAMFILSICLCLGNPALADIGDPVGVLYQVNGQVEFAKKGSGWRKIRHSKFLFAGYQVKTGPVSSAKVTLPATGKNLLLEADSLFEMRSDGIIAKQGRFTAFEESGSLESGLIKKFTKGQTYTTVRRSHSQPQTVIEMARSVVLTDEYPDLVWASLGKQYDYELTVGSSRYQVPATPEKLVRVRVQPFSGSQEIHIRVLNAGALVTELQPYPSQGQAKKPQASWLAEPEKKRLQAAIARIQDAYGDNTFLLGSLFEENNMWVAAMDLYRQYLQANPDEIEMTPYLFRVYRRLRLEDLLQEELEKWKTDMRTQ